MSHRRAYGPHGYRTPERKAQDIAAALLRHRAAGNIRFSAIDDFGLTAGTALYTLVEAAMTRLTTTA